MTASLRLPAPAKVNLTLEILAKRPDGYHELRSVFRALALHDTLSFEPAPSLHVSCNLPELEGPENLVNRAAALLAATAGQTSGARIRIEKQIPVAAGLGGGSSDAATTLRGLNELWQTGLTPETLADLGAQLGSDVPFFLYAGTALAAGRGETLTPLPALPRCPVVLVKPPIAVSTAAVYRMVRPEHYGDGRTSARFAALPLDTPPDRWPLCNALEAVTVAAYPVVGAVLAFLRDCGASQALMCGSGPTCFGLFAVPDVAQAAVAAAQERGWSGWLTEFA